MRGQGLRWEDLRAAGPLVQTLALILALGSAAPFPQCSWVVSVTWGCLSWNPGDHGFRTTVENSRSILVSQRSLVLVVSVQKD